MRLVLAPLRAAAVPELWLVLLGFGAASVCVGDAARHPLDPLSLIEYRGALVALTEAGHWDEETRLPLMTLAEPAKDRVLEWKAGDTPSRRAFAIVMREGTTYEAVIDVTQPRVLSWSRIEDVQPGILLTEEWETAQEIVRAHIPWREAIAERGMDDPNDVVVVPLTVGYFGEEREETDRLVKVLSFDSRRAGNFWGRPIEGLIAVVSLGRREVLELIDGGPVPIPEGEVDFEDGSGELRAAQGRAAVASNAFEIDGQVVRWRRWSFHWRLDARLGTVLSLVKFGDTPRSVLYQASLSEMFVPYTDPAAGWYFRAYMDAGEYGLGRLSSRLVPGRDCPEGAAYLHPFFVDEWGNPFMHERAACLFERNAGDIAWRHFESVTGQTETRSLTELVVRHVPAVGNYDYVLDWIFRPDGSIRVSVGATGVPQVKAVAPSRPARAAADGDQAPRAYGRFVAPNTVAVSHDHFFSYRLDFDVDGSDNSLLIERLESVQHSDGGPRSSGWVVNPSVPATESEARLRIDLERPALWRIVNPGVRGPLGYPVSYQLVPGRNAVSLFGATDFVQRRAGFTDFHLWVTPYAAEERYAAGSYPNQSRGGDGLPEWTNRDRPIRATDIVLWYTLGMHHVVRAEDWPVMPSTRSGFELRPFDFFPRNPLLPDP